MKNENLFGYNSQKKKKTMKDKYNQKPRHKNSTKETKNGNYSGILLLLL